MDDSLLDLRVVLYREGLVDVAPRDLVVDVRRVYDEAVLGRAPGIASRPDREGTRGCNVTLI